MLKPRVPKKRVQEHVLEYLQRRGVLTGDVARGLLKDSGRSLEELESLLCQDHGVTPAHMLLALAEHARLPVLSLRTCDVSAEVLAMLPRELLLRNRAVPVARTEGSVTLALADPLNLMAVEEVAKLSGLNVLAVAALEPEVLELLQGTQSQSREALGDMLQRAKDTAAVELSRERHQDKVDIDQMLESVEDAPVVRIVNMILVEAIRRRASDVHLEPFEREMRLRYRIDGVLLEGPAPPKALQSAITSRLKVMADLDIAERRVPQDGRFRIKAQGREVDMRVSVLPTIHGEKVVLRLLDRSNLPTDLAGIGLDPHCLGTLRHAIGQPHGLILVTGPTGSGKTTTLYSALQELNRPDVNLITVENPVEYQLLGINQVEINLATGMTFSSALRSILRQDPDIVLVGETRDRETAETAVKAALTGHLVMTTLHTNDACGAIARLVQLGVESFLLASSLRLAQAQRLVRRICPNCRERFLPPKTYWADKLLPEDLLTGTELYRGRGCSRCNGTGYRGRVAIMEVLPVSEAIRELILRSANAEDIRKLALEEGFRDLRHNGFERVREGVTTIEEVLRVTAGA